MKPLLAKDLPNFCSRFGNFVDAEIRSIDTISATTLIVTIACQDTARGFDWLTLNIEFSNVLDARLLDKSKLVYVDMSDGANMIFEDASFAFGVGNCQSISNVKSSSMFIISSSVKYEENSF